MHTHAHVFRIYCMPEVIENTFIFILRPHLGSNICGKRKTKIFFLLQTKYGSMDNYVLCIFEKIISNATCGNSMYKLFHEHISGDPES